MISTSKDHANDSNESDGEFELAVDLDVESETNKWLEKSVKR